MKNKYILFILLLSFILPIKVFALEGSLELECNSTTIGTSDKAKCVLYGNSADYVSAVELDIVSNSNLSVSSVKVPDIWEGDYEDNNLLLYTDTNKINKFKLLEFNLFSNKVGEYNISFKNIKFTDSSFERNNVSNKTYSITVITEEESNNETIVMDENGNIINNEDTNKTNDDTDNPKTGNFIPLVLILFALIVSGFTFVKVRNKKIFKL